MQGNRGRIGGILRKLLRMTALCSMFAAVLLGWELLALHGEQVESGAQEETVAGWGNEVLASRPAGLWPTSIIPPANACGLGASSCFQCHNGFRASTPSGEAWHTQHEAVNNSCTGCHKGNARILREDLAHRNMIVDPRQQPADSCAGCHEGEDVAQLVRKYLPEK